MALGRGGCSLTRVGGSVIRSIFSCSSRSCSSLVLRRSVAPQGLPFELSQSDALKHFGDWAKVHDAAKDVSSIVMGGHQTQAGVEIEPHVVPFWCFDVVDPGAWPSEQRHWVYAGVTHDATALRAALSEALDEAKGARPLEDVLAGGRSHRAPSPEVEEAALSARAAWEMAQSEHGVGVGGAGGAADVEAALHAADATALRAVALVYLPTWKVTYTYLGVPLTAWTCGRTGLTDGINCRGLGAEFFDGWLPQQHAFWAKAQGWAKSFDEQVGQSYARDPEGTSAAMTAAATAAGRAASFGVANALRLGARVAARHPKVAVAAFLAPYVVSWAKPVLESGWRAAQAQMRVARTQRRASEGGADDAAELDARADWEALLQRGEERLKSTQQPRGGKATGADKFRSVDVSDPRSVLGLPPRGRVSPRSLEAAFRRELLQWHPDRAERTPAAQEAAAERTRHILGAYKAMRRDLGL